MLVREKFITRLPPHRKNDDCDSENSWISGGLPNSRRRGEGRGKIKIEGVYECQNKKEI